MSANIAALLYLVSGALFIMALRGLSSPATSRQGNMYGMIGMAIAMVTTLATMQLSPMVIGLTVLGLAIGGGIGAYAAKNIAMTAMPQLVAAFHSLVGLAAVFVAAAAFYAPEAFHIVAGGKIMPLSRIEMSLVSKTELEALRWLRDTAPKNPIRSVRAWRTFTPTASRQTSSSWRAV